MASDQNKNLKRARSEKNDEFYTQFDDINCELQHYKAHFKDKVVFCNCDDPTSSQFWKFFYINFEFWGLKKLISTHYSHTGKSYFQMCDGTLDEEGKLTIFNQKLNSNGDFRSKESIDLLKQSDIVVTNPPFSLFREYFAQLIEHDKHFLIMGNNNAITYKEIFTLIKNNQLWLGVGSNKCIEFQLPTNCKKWDRVDSQGRKFGKVPAISWFTNLTHYVRNEPIALVKEYATNPTHYPKYDNYDAIEVSQVKNIPKDYTGYMGVPITFLGKFNPKQFEIRGLMNTGELNPGIRHPNSTNGLPLIQGVSRYARIIIKRI